MATLAGEKCVPCAAGGSVLTDVEVSELHPQAAEWQLIIENGVRKLQRAFKFKDFAAALAFTNAVGAAAETEGHHPRLVTEWGRVTVTWWTHKNGGLHRNDFIMAARTDEVHRSLLMELPEHSLAGRIQATLTQRWASLR